VLAMNAWPCSNEAGRAPSVICLHRNQAYLHIIEPEKVGRREHTPLCWQPAPTRIPAWQCYVAPAQVSVGHCAPAFSGPGASQTD
jgi:hypothetical protein